MPVLGLLGGMGWPSTALYYRTLNDGARAALGGDLHVLVDSLPFDAVLALADRDGFEAVGRHLTDEGLRLQRAGAQAILLCAVTAHLAYDAVARAVSVPVPHIGVAVARHVAQQGGPVGLLGTKAALTGNALFAKGAPAGRVLVPCEDRLDMLDAAIRTEVAAGSGGGLAAVQDALDDVVAQGAASVVLACTELPLLADRLRAPVPTIDAVALHCRLGLETLAAKPDSAVTEAER